KNQSASLSGLPADNSRPAQRGCCSVQQGQSLALRRRDYRSSGLVSCVATALAVAGRFFAAGFAGSAAEAAVPALTSAGWASTCWFRCINALISGATL